MTTIHTGKIPTIFYCCRLALGCRPILYILQCSAKVDGSTCYFTIITDITF